MEDSGQGRVPEAEQDAVARIVGQWRDHMPALDATPLLVLGRVMRIAERCDVLLRPPFAAAGLASGDFDTLAALRRAEPPHSLTPAELADSMLVTSGAVTKRVDRLEAAGLVTRTRSTQDGRQRVVALTGSGQELTDRLMQAHMDNERALLAPLAPDEVAELERLLARLLTAVEAPPIAEADEAD